MHSRHFFSRVLSPASSNMYDLIGDIHGHATELEQLLEELGYKQEEGRYRHPGRKAVFLGDFIDRGHQIREVLAIVRPMIDSGDALAVMGNHEFNALAYHTEDPGDPGQYLRRHSKKNIVQHQATIEQLKGEIKDAVDWFRELPIWLELEDENGQPLRIVHACWDDAQLQVISESLERYGGVSTEFLAEASRESSALYDAIECVLKGPELPLPNGKTIKDKQGHERRDIRIQWYREPRYEEKETYSQYRLPPLPLAAAPDEITRQDYEEKARSCRPYPEDAPPVFIGHYWLTEEPELLAPNIACTDYSVADELTGAERSLCAYRWDGEQRLDSANFKRVEAIPHQ